MTKIRLLVYGSNPYATYGTSKVNKEIFERIAKDDRFEVHFIAADYIGIPRVINNITLYPISMHPRGSKEWVKYLIDYCNEIQPHIFLPFTDAFLLFKEGIHLLNFTKSPIKTVGYFNLDSEVIPEGGNAVNKRCDKIIVSSNFSKEQYKIEGFDSEVIYHGVDTFKFKPLEDKEKRKKLREKYGFDEDDYVFLFVGRNARRKNIGALVDAFSRICYKYPTAKLLLHVPSHTQLFENVGDFINRYIVRQCDGSNPLGEKRIQFTDNAGRMGSGTKEQDIVELYQLADCYVSASNGEGFGLPICEAMSSCLPVVAPNNTTTPELITDVYDGIEARGIAAKCSYKFHVGFSCVHSLVDVQDLADKMEWMMNNADVGKEMGIDGRRFCEKYLKWDEKAAQFMDVLEKVHNTPKKGGQIEIKEGQ